MPRTWTRSHEPQAPRPNRSRRLSLFTPIALIEPAVIRPATLDVCDVYVSADAPARYHAA